MDELQVRRVRRNADRRAFLRLPWDVNEADPCWVPPIRRDERHRLSSRRESFFRRGNAEFFLVLRGKKPVGRLSAHIDYRFDEVHGSGAGFFGFFECHDDLEAAGALFDSAERWLIERGRTSIFGPLSFTIYDEIGVLVEGFDSTPYVMNGHNPPYYEDLLLGNGYRKEIDWYAYRGDYRLVEAMPKRLLSFKDRICSRSDFTLEPIRRRSVNSLLPTLKGIFDRAWEGSWGHTPMTDREFGRMARALKPFLITELSFVAFLLGQPIGFVVSVRDPNRTIRAIDGRLAPWDVYRLLKEGRRSDRFRLLMLALDEEYRNRGYDLAMYGTVIERGLDLGIRECEMSNVSELNGPMIHILKMLSAERYKCYRIFTKQIAGAESNLSTLGA